MLIALTFLALQPVKNLLLGTTPRIHATILNADSERIWIIASNDGNGPAALVSIRITANLHSGGAWDTVLSFDAIEDRILRPGEIKIISIPHNHKIPEIAGPGVIDAAESCNLSVQYFELEGQHVITVNPFKYYLNKNQ
jgi:hypothetical protein